MRLVSYRCRRAMRQKTESPLLKRDVHTQSSAPWIRIQRLHHFQLVFGTDSAAPGSLVLLHEKFVKQFTFTKFRFTKLVDLEMHYFGEAS